MTLGYTAQHVAGRGCFSMQFTLVDISCVADSTSVWFTTDEDGVAGGQSQQQTQVTVQLPAVPGPGHHVCACYP